MNTKITNQLSLFNTPIAQGVLNGVNWRSLTSVSEMKLNVLEHVLIRHNRTRMIQCLEPISMDKFIKKEYFHGANNFIDKINRMDLYKIRGKYSNYKRIK